MDKYLLRKRYIIVNIMILIYIISCNNTNKNESFVMLDTLLIKKSFELKYEGVNSNSLQQKNDTLFANFYPYNNVIYKYIISKQIIVDTIKISNFHLSYFYYVNKDSIWIYGDNEKLNYSGVLCLVNSKGDIKQKFDLMDRIGNYGYPYNLHFITDNQNNFTGKIVFCIQDFALNGFLNKNKQYSKKPIIGLFDALKNELVLNEEIKYPYLNENVYYPDGMYDFYYPQLYVMNAKKILIGFKYTPKFYLWDIVKNKIEQKYLKTKFVDTIKPCNKPCESADIPSYDEFYKISNNVYARFIVLSKKYDGTVVMILTDSNLNKISECIYPKKFPLPWLYNNKSEYNFCDDKSNRLRLIKANIYFKISTYDNLIKNLEQIRKDKVMNEDKCGLYYKNNKNDIATSEQIMSYFNNYLKIKENDFSVIALNKYGCGSCNETILKFIKINKDVLFKIKSKPFYILFAEKNESKENLDRKYSVLGINENTKNIKFDTSSVYEKINNFNLNNPRLILVKNSKVIFDTIYMPDQLEKLLERLMNFYGFVQE